MEHLARRSSPTAARLVGQSFPARSQKARQPLPPAEVIMASRPPNTEIVPGYVLSKLLGRGEFGEVWKGTGPGGIEVAVKVISLADGRSLKEFRSIRLCRNLKHPNLVPFFGFWLKDRHGNVLSDDNADEYAASQAVSDLIMAMGLGEKSLADRL